MLRHRILLVAVAALAATACQQSRPVSTGGGGDTVVIPGGDASGGTVQVSITACTKCHGDPARTAAATDAAGVQIAPPRDNEQLASGGTKIGAHLGHLHGTTFRASAIDCASCHVVPTNFGTHPGASEPKVQLRGLATAAWSGTIAPVYTASSGAVAAGCASTYCHGNFPGGLNRTMSWNGSAADAACGTCHGSPPAFMTDGKTAHSSSINCASCHGPGYAVTGITGAALATHIDGIFQAPAGSHATGWVDTNLTNRGGPHAIAFNEGGSSACTACHGATLGGSSSVPACTACHDGGNHAISTAAGQVVGPIVAFLSGTSPNCSACHGTVGAAAADAAGADTRPRPPLATRRTTARPDSGSHAKHAVPASGSSAMAPLATLTCNQCHATPGLWYHAGGSVSLAWGAVATAGGASPVFTQGTNGCASTYCHGSFRNGNAGNSPVWGTPATGACGTCHGTGTNPLPTTTASGGTHPAMATAAGNAETCATCHAGYTASSVSASVHVNGKIEVLGSTCTLAAGCTIVDCTACHGNPPVTTAIVDPGLAHPQQTDCGTCHPGATGPGPGQSPGPGHMNGRVDLTALVCTSCHGDVARPGLDVAGAQALAPAPPVDTAGLTTGAKVGAHMKHLMPGGSGGPTFSRQVACSECHSGFVPSTPLHANGQVNVAFGTLATTAGITTAAYAGGNCSNTYCHGNFKNGAGVHAIGWATTGTAQCGSCHAIPPAGNHPAATSSTCGNCHGNYDNATSSIIDPSLHVDGILDLSKVSCTACHGTAGRASVASADVNQAVAPPVVASATGVAGVHLAHVNQGSAPAVSLPFLCSNCHVVPTSNAHSNGVIDVAFAGLSVAQGAAPPAYNLTARTCSSTYCHGNFVGGLGNAAAPPWSTAGKLACTVCHLAPPVPAAATASVKASYHPNNPTCSACHPAGYSATAVTGTAVATHVDGLVTLNANRTGCVQCHGTPGLVANDATNADSNVAAAPPSDSKGNAVATAVGVGAHVAHVNHATAGRLSLPIHCTECHGPDKTDRTHADGNSTPIFGTLAKTGNVTPTYAAPNCSATYCHGNFTGGRGAAAAPPWTTAGQLGCNACHGQGATAAATPPGPISTTVKHPQNANCVACHAGYSTTTVNAATHVDGVVNKPTGCTACHGDLTATGVASTDVRAAPGVNANATDTIGSASTATGVRGIGAHAMHLNGTTWRAIPMACSECHAVPAANDVTHVTGVAVVAFGTGATDIAKTAWAGKPAITPVWNGAGGAATLTCSSTYCHGNFPGGLNATPTWATPSTVACGSCHAIPPLLQSDGVTAHSTSTACGTCHGAGYTSTTVDKSLHMNGRIDGGGESAGGSNCGGCHSAYFNAMNGTTTGKFSKHTLGSDVPLDGAFTWGNPLSTTVIVTNRTCVNMCHADHPHDLTSPVTATHENNVYLNATTQATRASGSVTRVGAGGTGTQNRARTDFDSTLNAGVCASCHANPIVANGITVGAANFGASAHDFAANTVGATTYTWNYALHDGSLFARNCTKCHASRTEGNTSAVGSGATLVAVHYSDTDPNLLSGTTNPAGTAANFVCYNCHGTTATPAVGAQGNRSGKDIQSQIAHATTAGQSGHPANSDAVHNSATEFATAVFGNTLGVTGRHASCLDCHDPHEAKAGTHAVTTNFAGPPLQGAWGAKFGGTLAAWTAPTSANFTKTTIVAGTELEATLCFKCHSAFYGTLPTSPSSSPTFTETDQAKEFNPANVSFHPVLATAGATIGAVKMANLVTTNFAWRTTGTRNLMTCTDCHESDTATDPNGPHGSASKFILKGPNTAWLSTTTNNGTMNGAFCANCHSSTFANSRFPAHTRGDHFIACMNCHAAIPHGGPRAGMLNPAAGTTTATLPAIATWDGVAPYWQGGASNRLYLKSYPASNTTDWAQGNCGCNGTSH